MKHSTKLLIICPEYPDLHDTEYGGIFVKQYVDLIKSYFSEIYVIVPIPYFPIPKFFCYIPFLRSFLKYKNFIGYNYMNVTISYPKYVHLPISFFRKRLWHTHAKKILYEIKKSHLWFDIIHSHFTWPSGYAAVEINRKYNKKIILTSHEDRDTFQNYFSSQNEIYMKIWSWVNMIIRVNQDDISTLRSINPKSTYIPNSYNDDIFFLWDKKKNQKKIIVSVWWYNSQKNHETLLKSCYELSQIRQDFYCYLIWSWPLEEYLNSKIRELWLENYVLITWKKSQKEIALYLNQADIFVLPSLSESFGIVTIEALASWVPVITSKNGGSENIIINDDYGYIYNDPKDSVELTRLMNLSFNKSWDYKKIAQYAKTNFSKKVVKKKYRKVFAWIL